MSRDEVKDFECKITQTFAQGQPALARVVLDAYRTSVAETTFKQTLLLACNNLKLTFELQAIAADCLKYPYQKVELFKRGRHRRQDGADGRSGGRSA
jgi:hypothetical protein